MKRQLLCALLALASPVFAAGATTPPVADSVFAHPQSAEALRALLSAPARQLAAAQALRGEFVQQKFLRELPTPLPSDGDFLFVRGLGIAWHTKHPLDSEFILTPGGMLQKDGGNVSLRLSASEQPALQVALRLFVALFSLDLQALDADFALYGEKTGERWQLGLAPKNTAMSAVFDQALISGASAVERIELRDHNGDRTEIVIRKLQSGGTVSAEDRKRLSD